MNIYTDWFLIPTFSAFIMAEILSYWKYPQPCWKR